MEKRDIYNQRLKRFEIACRKPQRLVISWQVNARAAREFAKSKGLEVVSVQLRPIEKDIR